jgi:RNA polymerase sigma factor (sigma-70 family)
MLLEGAALRLLSDERLAHLAAEGDRAAFAVIFDRYHQRLFSYCASILRNRDDAADALQSTMLRAMRALEGEGREIAVRPWLYRIAHNEAITLLRRPTAEPGSGAEVVTIDDVEGAAAVRAHLRTVLADIRELPDRQRSALVMRELAGLSYGEIGAALETSEAGAKQAVYDARQALHQLAKGRESDCDTIRRKLSDGDRRVFRGRAVRAHLTACTDCRTWQAELAARESSWAAFAPTMPAAAAAGALQSALGGGAGAAAAGGMAATASGPALATVVVAVVLGAGAVGVSELTDDDDRRPVRGGEQALVTPGTAALTGSVSEHTRKAGDQVRAVSRGGGRTGDSSADDKRTGAGGKARRGDRSRGSGGKRGRSDVGEGSTALGRGGSRSGSTGTGGGGTRGGRGGGGNGVKSWLGGRGRGNGGQSGNGGPIRSTVDGTRDAVENTVNQVQGVLPVPTPPLPAPIIRPPSEPKPKSGR